MNHELTSTIEECQAKYKDTQRRRVASLISHLAWELANDIDDAEAIAIGMYDQIQEERYYQNKTPLPSLDKFL